jgi:excinuclease UvrABC nuclease subunit
MGITYYPTYLFSEQVINDLAPEAKGVYGLYDDKDKNTVLYYGQSENLKRRLLEHFRGQNTSCTQSAKYFNFEVTKDANETERGLLIGYQVVHGKLPRCNEQIG